MNLDILKKWYSIVALIVAATLAVENRFATKEDLAQVKRDILNLQLNTITIAPLVSKEKLTEVQRIMIERELEN